MFAVWYGMDCRHDGTTRMRSVVYSSRRRTSVRPREPEAAASWGRRRLRPPHSRPALTSDCELVVSVFADHVERRNTTTRDRNGLECGGRSHRSGQAAAAADRSRDPRFLREGWRRTALVALQRAVAKPMRFRASDRRGGWAYSPPFPARGACRLGSRCDGRVRASVPSRPPMAGYKPTLLSVSAGRSRTSLPRPLPRR
jgi:hypothetical protein